MLRRKRITSPSVLETPFTPDIPEVGANRRLTSLSDVVLPDPLRPSSASVFPLWTCN